MLQAQVPNSINLPKECLTQSTPMLFREWVADWPSVDAGKDSKRSFSDYLLQFYNGAQVTAYEVDASSGGRIFYNDDFTGFNFARTRKALDRVLNEMLMCAVQPSSPTHYIGSTSIKHWLPGFEQDNPLDMLGLECLNSIWLGNQSLVAPHFDFPNNLACVVAGRRRFTLFPPEQMSNLYIGPVDITPSGQPISLVDVRNPDFKRFPKFRQAEEAALVFDLEPGDALFIPSMWWHSVESMDELNGLVNYWWRTTPAYLGSPLGVLHHALLSFNGLTREERENWGRVFNELVFQRDQESISHLPRSLRGMYDELDHVTAQKVKRHLNEMLKS